MPVVTGHGGARADFVPHSAIHALLADARLVLEPDLQRLFDRLGWQGRRYEGGEVF